MSGSKLVVVGAGSVGSSLAYAALIRGSASNIALFDVNAAKADAEVLDLAHGTQFAAAAASMTGGGDIAVTEGADVVVITAGAKQAPGQTRLDLAGTNVRILEELMPRLIRHAPEAVYVLVTNPCDVLTVAAQKISGLPAGRIFSSGTVLDTSRLRWLLAAGREWPCPASTPASWASTGTPSFLCGQRQPSDPSRSATGRWTGNASSPPNTWPRRHAK